MVDPTKPVLCFANISGLLVLEQVCVASLDCNRLDIAERCLLTLSMVFPTSLRVRRLQALKLEAMGRCDY